MTLLLATLARDFAMLGADRRTQEGAELRQADGDKLIRLGGCAVACHGASPPGINVPALIRETATDAQSSPYEVARVLQLKIQTLENPGNFGLLVVGSGTKDLEIWEAPQGGTEVTMLDPLTLYARPTSIHVMSPQAGLDIQQMRNYLLSLFQDASAKSPSNIGPPFEIAEFRFGRPPTITRHG